MRAAARKKKRGAEAVRYRRGAPAA